MLRLEILAKVGGGVRRPSRVSHELELRSIVACGGQLRSASKKTDLRNLEVYC